MNITNADIDDLPLEDFANKDGTIQRSSSSGEKDGKPQQSMLEKFFEKKRTFNKRTKDKGKIIAEEIEESSENSQNEGDELGPQVTNWDEEVKKAATSEDKRSSCDQKDDGRRLSSEFRSQ